MTARQGPPRQLLHRKRELGTQTGISAECTGEVGTISFPARRALVHERTSSSFASKGSPTQVLPCFPGGSTTAAASLPQSLLPSPRGPSCDQTRSCAVVTGSSPSDHAVAGPTTTAFLPALRM